MKPTALRPSFAVLPPEGWRDKQKAEGHPEGTRQRGEGEPEKAEGHPEGTRRKAEGQQAKAEPGASASGSSGVTRKAKSPPDASAPVSKSVGQKSKSDSKLGRLRLGPLPARRRCHDPNPAPLRQPAAPAGPQRGARDGDPSLPANTTVLAAAFMPAVAAPLTPSAGGGLPAAGPADSGTLVAIAALWARSRDGSAVDASSWPVGTGSRSSPGSAGWCWVRRTAGRLGADHGDLLRHDGIRSRTGPAPTQQGQQTVQTPPAPPALPAFAEAGAEAPPSRLARRWLPDRTALVFSVCEAQLAAQPEMAKSLDLLDPQWKVSVGALLHGLKLSRQRAAGNLGFQRSGHLAPAQRGDRRTGAGA